MKEIYIFGIKQYRMLFKVDIYTYCTSILLYVLIIIKHCSYLLYKAAASLCLSVCMSVFVCVCTPPLRHDRRTATKFGTHMRIDMQALPDSSHDQTCDKTIVDTYYLGNCQTMEVQTIDAEQVNQFIMRLKEGNPQGSMVFYHPPHPYPTCGGAG